MKKGLFFLFLAFMLMVMAACGSTEDASGGDTEEAPVEDTTEEAQEEDGDATSDADLETYQVVTDNNYRPFEFLDESGELVGFDIDLMNAIADEAGFVVEFEQMEFAGIVAAIASERFDAAIAGMTITEERKESIDFSIPYYDAGLILAVQYDNEDITSIDDITADHSVATRTGSTSENFLSENTDASIEAFPEITEAYQNTIQGRSDAVLYDLPNVLYYAETASEGQLKIVGELLAGEQYGIAFPQGSELKAKVDAALETLMEDGTYGDIYEKWFGSRPEGM
ncbi:transporter substrate-binding domain-containing protein [Bacillus sp. FJAT-45350]|uniref:transporter substrate-binding domain-containing protein n=1 Tax=Bacillus sp. FJAT-45350 TaxID=2011014 RepID=UPI000BB7ADBB|nr:transporter substrate-binding domain-containing protein [Bacillus sp. FJAT-45350]